MFTLCRPSDRSEPQYSMSALLRAMFCGYRSAGDHKNAALGDIKRCSNMHHLLLTPFAALLKSLSDLILFVK